MKSTGLLITLILSSHLLFGQDLKSYQGEYKFNGIEGQANFNYQLDPSNESILQGNFKFESSTKGSYSENVFIRKSITGRYEQNKKIGQWDYLDEEHMVTLDEVIDFNVVSRLESHQVKITANYISGLPNGKWTIEENVFEEGKPKRTAQSDAITFQTGNLIGHLQYKTFADNQTQFVKARLLEGGILHGELTMVYESEGKLVSETRKYENGFLLGIVKRNLLTDEIIEDIIFYNTIAKLNELESGNVKNYRIADEVFGILYQDAFLKGSIEAEAQADGNEFIEIFLHKLLKNEEAYINGNKDLIRSPLHTRRFVYEISRSDQKFIEDAPAIFKDNQSNISEYLSLPSLNLLKNKSDSTAIAFRYLEIQGEKLEQLAGLINQFESKQIQFLDQKLLLENTFSWLGEADTVQVSYMDESLSQIMAYGSATTKESLYEKLYIYLDEQRDHLRKQFRVLEAALEDERKSSVLLDINQQIESKTELVKILYSAENFEDNRIKPLAQHITSNILGVQLEELRVKYASAENFTEKQTYSNVILNLLGSLENQASALKAIHADFDKMDSLYQEEVFNPFTYTRYNQRIQERLFDSYETLYNYYIQEIKTTEDFTRLNALIKMSQSLNQKMIELRGQDTKRLERRLNKEKSPLKLESIFEL
ncbi:hypothetical protein [Algoriphagus sp.]|uniref:hypothetical protein n=1 Tax=Algoriphagus sp. TaxID=1872435 RepID=UPI003F7151E8